MNLDHRNQCVRKHSHHSVTRIAWTSVALLAVAGVFAPILTLIVSSTGADVDTLSHVRDNLLGRYAINSAVLIGGVVAGSVIVGVSLATLTSFFSFPGHRFFRWALVLPLAMPGYVLGFVYLGVFDSLGMSGTMRSMLGLQMVLTLGLYPYVYLLSQLAFRSFAATYLEVGACHGVDLGRCLTRAILPAAIPWLSSGAVLVALETLSDFATSAIFSVDTLTVGIYRTWYGLFSFESASLLALVTLTIGVGFLGLKSMTSQHPGPGLLDRSIRRRPLTSWGGLLASISCTVVWTAAVGVPTVQLVAWGLDTSGVGFDEALATLTVTLVLAATCAGIIAAVAVVMSMIGHAMGMPTLRNLLGLAVVGYGLPGTVVSVLMVQFAASVTGATNNMLTLSVGTLGVLLFGYYVKFFGVSWQPISNSWKRTTRHFDDICLVHGVPMRRVLSRYYWPTLRPGFAIATLLVTVEICKEVPLTMMLRPFGLNTLATRTYEFASEGEWQHAAIPALLLFLVSLAPVLSLQAKKLWSEGGASR